MTAAGHDSPSPASRPADAGEWRAWWPWLWALLLAAAVYLVYQPAWLADFIWDDDGHLTRASLRSLAGLRLIWIEPTATQQYYPLTHTVFWVLNRLVGQDPTGYHLVNIGLHVLNVGLVYLVLRRLAIPGAALAASVFALHPVMVESVAWVSEIKNTLSGLLYLSAMLCYLDYDRARRASTYLLAMAFFSLALLAKTVTASLPAALLVIFWWQRGRIDWRRDVVPLLPFFVIGLALGLLTAMVERILIGAVGAIYELTPVERLLLAGRVVWFYAGKLFWPADLIFVYPRWTISPADPLAYVYGALALVALGACWFARKRTRAPLAAALFFCGTLFPALGFFNVYPFRYSYVADHFQYLASLGLIAVTAATLTRLAAGWSRGARVAAALGLLGVLGGLTWRQSRTYENVEVLYRTTLARNPAAGLAHVNLGNFVHQQRSAIDQAEAHYRAAVAINSDNALGHYNLGIIHKNKGEVADAIAEFREAARLDPEYFKAHYNLGLLLAYNGQEEEGERELAETVRLMPRLVDARIDLGLALLRLNRRSEALHHLREAVTLEPGYQRAKWQLWLAENPGSVPDVSPSPSPAGK